MAQKVAIKAPFERVKLKKQNPNEWKLYLPLFCRTWDETNANQLRNLKCIAADLQSFKHIHILIYNSTWEKLKASVFSTLIDTYPNVTEIYCVTCPEIRQYRPDSSFNFLI